MAIYMLWQAYQKFLQKQAIPYLTYSRTSNFMVRKKKTGKRNRGRNFWFEVSDEGKNWVDTVTVTKDEFKKYEKGMFLGERDIYISTKNQKVYRTIEVGQTPDLSGETELIEMLVYLVIAVAFFVGAFWI